jgi:hypothetical protein
MQLPPKIARHLSNLPGWRTNRKIIVFESDDWGSIRMPSREAFNRLLSTGIQVDNNHYNRFDALESNADIEGLFDILSAFKDKNGNHPVFTGACVVANPDFEKIKRADFKQYFYEPFTQTLKRYPAHDRVFDLWKEGINKRLFVPQFHGREHLNVRRWLRDLQAGNTHTMLAFDNQLWGITSSMIKRGYQPAFEPDTSDDIKYHAEVISEGVELFEELLGYSPRYIVPPNGPFSNRLMPKLEEKRIKYIMVEKWQKEPLGDGRIINRFHYLGKKNSYGIMYLSRNASFEPALDTSDWVDKCLADIDFAFRIHKPATISTHRVNYIGYLNASNRSRNLLLLKELLRRIIVKWPEVEFFSSIELGDLINQR